MGKTAKGNVAVILFRNRLVLRWSHGGKRHTLYLGLPDTVGNWIVAEGKACQIAGDMATGNFDPSLNKYRPKLATESVTIVNLFEAFHKFRQHDLRPSTNEKYRAIAVRLKQHFANKRTDTLTQRDAEKFRDWLLTLQKPCTVQDRLTVIGACWKWAESTDRVTTNPWGKVKLRVENETPDPFDEIEIAKIIAAFECDRHYSHYTPYVRFLLATGCRVGEAIGLRWKNLSENCDRVDIVERLDRSGEWRDTKNHKVRALALTPKLQAMLLKHRPEDWQPDGLVFPSPKGTAIHGQNFGRRAWAIMLEKAGVRYRRPYNVRHTALSHAIARGVSPARVAEMAGDRIATVLKNYVGNVEGLPKSLDY